MSASPAAVPRGASSSRVLPSGQTLRALLDARRSAGSMLGLDEAIAMIVPLCLDLKAHHDRGEKLYVHPSCVVSGPDGLARLEPSLAVLPTTARDRTCMAPEQQARLEPGGPRSSVFAIGAMLYEMVTGTIIGPAMQRPRDINPDLPESLETLLGKALVGDPQHRPDDLGALASAMHHLAPMKSVHPPSADESRLDRTDDFEVDVRLSMLPPSEVVPSLSRHPAAPTNVERPDPFGHVSVAPKPMAARANDPTSTLAALKERLESDPRPRYVVNKERMDHGPFAAVELLQQIISNQFVGTDILRDELSGQSRPIKEWEEFAAFSDQAQLKREIVAEKIAVVAVEKKEKAAGIAKFLVGGGVILAIAAGAAVWFFTVRGSRKDDVSVSDDPNAMDLELSGGVNGQKRGGGGRGGRGGGGGGGFPSGLSYEQALASNVQEVNIGGGAGGPDLTDSQLAAPMRNAGFISACGAPDSMKVTVKVAIKNGHAVGVSVYCNPPDAKVASCVDHAVRGIGWPSNPKMDSFTTTY